MAQDLNLNVLLGMIDKATAPLKKIRNASSQTADAVKATGTQLRGINDAQKNVQGYREARAAMRSNARELGTLQAKSADYSRALKAQGDRHVRYKSDLATSRREYDKLAKAITATERPTAEMSRLLDRSRGRLNNAQHAFDESARSIKQYRNQSREAGRQASRLGRTHDDTRQRLDRYRGQLDQAGISTRHLARDARQLARREADLNQRLERQTRALKRLKDADVSGKFNNMTQSVGRFSRRLLFGIGAAGGSLFALANSTAELGDNTAKMADKIGIGLGQLQELRYAAERSGVGVQKFDSSLERFVKRTGEAALGTGAAKKAFEQLGLSAEDLANLKPDQAFARVADRLADVDNQTQRVALAAQLFGREGVAMVNMIKNGSAGLREMGRDARETGYILSDKAARDAETFKDRLLDATLGLKGMKNTIGAALLPAITQMMSDLSFWMRENRDRVQEFAKTFGDKLGDAIPIIANMARGFASAAATIATITAGLAKLVGGYENLGAIVGTVFAGKAIVSVLSFGGAIFKAGSALVSLTGALPLVATGIRAIGAALTANPIGLAVAAVAGAAYLIYRNWNSIATFFKARWADVKEAFSGGVGAVAELLLNWSPLGLLYRGITAALDALGIEIPQQFRSLGSAMVNGIIGGISDMGSALKNKVTGLASDVGGWFKDKLGINSPSRVFAGYGANTVEGYRLGVANNQTRAARQVRTMGSQIARAGAGIGLAAAMLPAAANTPGPGSTAALPSNQPIQFDSRPPVARSNTRNDTHVGGITINVQGAPGQDETALAQQVAQQVQQALDNQQRQQATRRRSALYDTE